MSRAIGSLCSGYGGLDAAAEQLTGGVVKWVSDIDKGACKILAHRYPGIPNLGDFTTTDWSTVAPIYMLTAGYPCQPFSGAGKRMGVDDPRHLWPYVLRCLTALRPPFALFENVRGHLSLGFDQVLADLASHDYDARWIVLRAADIGAPHGRARLFILAADAGRGGDRWDLVGAGRGAVRVGGVRGEDPDTGGDAGRADLLGGMSLLPTPTVDDSSNVSRASGDFQSLTRTVSLLPTPEASDSTGGRKSAELGGFRESGAKRAITLATVVDHLPGAMPWITTDDGWTLPKSLAGLTGSGPLLPTPAVNDMGASYTPDEWDAWTDRMKAEHGNGNGHGKSLHIEAQRLLPTPSTGESLNGHGRRGGKAGNGSQSGADLDALAKVDRWGDYEPAIRRWESLTRPAPEPTQTGGKGNPQLSARFVEWMMGLPEGWVCDVPDMSRNECLKALGNGVVTQQAVEGVRRLLTITERAA